MMSGYMPEFFSAWLRTLSDEQADELWLYLDADPDAIDASVTVLVNSHPKVLGKHMNSERPDKQPC